MQFATYRFTIDSMVGQSEKIVVAMSGGVDSSVTACLLREQGYEVVGLFMRVGAPGAPDTDVAASEADACCAASSAQHAGAAKQAADLEGRGRAHQGCCSAADAADARYVAGMLDMPFYALNFEEEFDKIIDYFADEYASGRTPNPCVVCNNQLKFGKLIDYADAVGARYVATGHYARIGRRNGTPVLMRAVDRRKDQSYFLFGMQAEVLDRALFPIGDLDKSEVRRLATKYNLPNQHKPDSVEICFVPDRDYARVVRQRRPDVFVEGEVRDSSGTILGTHNGVGHFTIGQRRGLGIAAGVPKYITQLNVASNTVTVGDSDDLLCRELMATKCNILAPMGESSFRCHAKIRYLHRAAPATATLMERDRLHLVFDEPQRAITPGQAVVLYDDDVVIGGAWIASGVSEAVSGPALAAPHG